MYIEIIEYFTQVEIVNADQTFKIYKSTIKIKV